MGGPSQAPAWSWLVGCVALPLLVPSLNTPHPPTLVPHADYQLEAGATRNYEPWRDKEKVKAAVVADREEEERGNAMKVGDVSVGDGVMGAPRGGRRAGCLPACRLPPAPCHRPEQAHARLQCAYVASFCTVPPSAGPGEPHAGQQEGDGHPVSAR